MKSISRSANKSSFMMAKSVTEEMRLQSYVAQGEPVMAATCSYRGKDEALSLCGQRSIWSLFCLSSVYKFLVGIFFEALMSLRICLRRFCYGFGVFFIFYVWLTLQEYFKFRVKKEKYKIWYIKGVSVLLSADYICPFYILKLCCIYIVLFCNVFQIQVRRECLAFKS